MALLLFRGTFMPKTTIAGTGGRTGLLPPRNSSKRQLSMSNARRAMEKKEAPFSQSQAYYGRDRLLDPTLRIPLYIPSYYDSNRFKTFQLLSAFIAMGSLGIYVCCFREERDTDELYKMDPRLATIGQKKHMIMHKINMRRQADGSDADVRDLESELLEIVASEAEIVANLDPTQRSKYFRPPKQFDMLQNEEISKEKKLEESNKTTSAAKRWGIW